MKKTSIRRGLAWLLVLVMVLSAVPFGVFAETVSQDDGAEESAQVVCVCKDRAKCTGETVNTACPVCAVAGADLDNCCQGKTQEQLNAEAAAKQAAEEEAAKQAAEEAAQKASEEAVKNVQDQIDALPRAGTITAENRGDVEAALTAIDEAKGRLTDEEQGKLDLANYDSAANAVKKFTEQDALKNELSAQTVEAQTAVLKLVLTVRKKDMTTALADNGSVTLIKEGATQGDTKNIDPTTGVALFENLEIGTYQLIAKVTVNGIERTTESTVAISQESLGATTEVPVTVIEPKVTISTTIEGDMPICGSSELSISGLEELESELEKVESADTVIAIKVKIDDPFVTLPPDVRYRCNIDASCNRVIEGVEEAVTAAEWGILQKKGCWLVVPIRPAGYQFDVTNSGESRDGDGVVISPGDVVKDKNGNLPMVFQRNESSLGIRLITFTDKWTFGIEPAEGQKGSATIRFNRNGSGAQVTQESIAVAKFQQGEQWYCGLLDGRIRASRPGYVFQGWATTQDATESNVTKDSLIPIDGVEVTLYAVWARMMPTQTENGITVHIADAEELNDILSDPSSDFNHDILLIKRAFCSDTQSLLEDLELDKNTKIRAANVELFRNEEQQRITELPRTLCFSFDVDGLDKGILRVQRKHENENHNDQWQSLPCLSAKPTDGQTEGFYLDGTTLYIYSKKFSTFAAYSVPYTVTFEVGSCGEVNPKNAAAGPDGLLTSLPIPTRPDYAFGGWYLDEACTDTALDTTHVYTADTTVYAKWIPWTYTVTFDGNGGRVKNSVKTSQDVSAQYGAEVTPPEFVRDYYTLTAWARNADGTEKVSTPIKDLASKDGDKIALYAVWEYAPRTVTFDADGGKITENKQAVASVTRITQESPINTLKATDLPVPDSREGWYFGGWYTQKDGKGDLVKAGSTEFQTDSTVYAYWIAFEPVTVTLKCQRGSMTVDGKTVTTGTMQTKWPGVLDGTLPTPARSGWKFQGWFTAAGIKVDENTVFLKDTTLYARWTSAVSGSGNPKTGDQVRLGLAGGILAAAAVGLTVAIVVRKRKK